MKDKAKSYSLLLIALLALITAGAVSVPRFLAFGPGITGVLFLALYPWAFGQRPRFSKPVFIIVAAVTGLALVSCLWAIDPGDALGRALRMALVVVSGAFLVNLSLLLDVARVRPYLWLLPAAVMAIAVLVFVELECGAPLHRLVRGMAAGEFVPPAKFNRAMVTMALCFFPAMAILRRYVSMKIMAGLIVALVFPALLVTESQSAQLALFFGTVFLAVFPYKRKAAWCVLFGGIVILILSAPFVSTWLFRNFAMDVQSVPLLGQGGAYAGNRLEIWDYVSRYALQKPFLGFGIEAAREITDFDSHEIFQEGKSILHPHNFVLQLWLEFGVIGALCSAGLIGYLLNLMRTKLSPAQCRIALPTLIAVLSVASTGYGMWQGWWLGLLFLSASFCILAIRLEADLAKTVA